MEETPKKTRTTKAATAAKPRKAATKKTTNGVAAGAVNGHDGAAKQRRVFTHEEVALLAHSYWQQRGGRHGHHQEDWARAEQELLRRAS